MADLLFEIGTEELPSWYVSDGSEALARLLAERLAAADIPAASVEAYATPRRLAVVARGLPERSAERVDELRGPPASVAFAEDGTPTRAAQAFAAKNGVALDALERRDTEKGSYLYARVAKGGEAAAELLPPLLEQVVRDLPAPRKMRWGEVETPFLRPIAWLLALLDERALEVEVAGVKSGTTTRGHRFLAGGPLAVPNPAAYEATLREAWVIADRAERRAATAEGLRSVATEAGLAPYHDPRLLDEVTDLLEWPFPILGAFDHEYLELPEEVLATVMITHQRFFPTRGEGGQLAPRFVGVANNRVDDEAVVRRGYEQVLAGRLYDARFFWQSDRRKSLSQHAWGLSGIAFQKELGSMADKSARVGVTAGLLLGALAIEGEEAAAVEQALPIFRADLATEMIYEFPELEGVMGRAYALAEGLPRATADALLGGVSPKSHDDEVPATVAGAVLALADRTDKLVGFFALGKRPTGSADPFGLRRDGLAVVRVLASRGWSLPLTTLVEAAAVAYADSNVSVDRQVQQEVVEFLWDRVASLLAEQGAAVPVVRAAIRGSLTVTGAARRVELLEALMERAEFADLMALYKRAANLAGKAEGQAPPAARLFGAAPEPSTDGAAVPGVKVALFREPPEAPLHAALPAARLAVQRLMTAAKEQLPAWDLRDPAPAELTGIGDAIAEVVGLKAPLDAFLDGVLVMAEEQDVRRNRLALLAEVVRVLRQLGALEELEGTEQQA